MRVLVLNHTAEVSGGEQALLDLVVELQTRSDVQVAVAAPRGRLSDELSRRGIRWLRVPGTTGSLRLHPLGTPKALAEMVLAGWAARRAARRFGADLLHANTMRAGLSGAVARLLGGPPLVVHEHDLLPDGTASRAVIGVVTRVARVVLANSAHVADRLRRDAAGPAVIRVVHNPVDSDRFRPRPERRGRQRSALSVGDRQETLAVIAQITPWKGQEEAIRALAALRAEGRDAVLLLAGEVKFVARATRYDNREYKRSLDELVTRMGLDAHVRWLGQVADVPSLLDGVDVLLVPSWEEPFGLAVVEALSSEVPVVATTPGGPAEVLRDGVDGRLVPSHDPAALAAAAAWVLDGDRAAMGRRGRARVLSSFTRPAFAARVLEGYRLALDAPSR